MHRAVVGEGGEHGELEFIYLMAAVDLFAHELVLADAGADIAVEHRIGEAEIILVILPHKPSEGALSTSSAGSPSSLPICLTSSTVKWEHGLKSPTLSP